MTFVKIYCILVKKEKDIMRRIISSILFYVFTILIFLFGVFDKPLHTAVIIFWLTIQYKTIN
ncbi:hypothetical protein DRQ29_02800 [bacterium]|nr:MAG: hypothetical protein DRQ29_02800 [bacterium]